MEPFKKLTKAEFDLRGLESQKHAAKLQYDLMLIEPVIRVHIDFRNKKALVLYDNRSKNTKKLLDTFKPVRATLKSKEPVDYKNILSEGYHEAF
jgi:hypothetical protein